MAAFSYQNQHPPPLNDLSVFLPNSPIKMSGLLEEGYLNSTSSCFPYSSLSEHFQEIPFEKQRTDSSSIVDDLEGSSDQLTQMVNAMEKKRNNRDGSCLSSDESKDSKGARGRKQRTSNGKSKETEHKKKNQKKDREEHPNGYVHVRARRGEATDSHSLAERVRREKISERLKLLQSLVPGCDKVTSKAIMLDEIINYVQSLQHQVEFLSMRIACTSPMGYNLAGHDITSMVKPDKLSSLVSPSTAVADITANNYPLTDSPASYLLKQRCPKPNVFFQDNGNLLRSVDEHRQRFFNQPDFSNLCSFQ